MCNVDTRFSPANLAPFSHYEILHFDKTCVGLKLPRSIPNRFPSLSQAILVLVKSNYVTQSEIKAKFYDSFNDIV